MAKRTRRKREDSALLRKMVAQGGCAKEKTALCLEKMVAQSAQSKREKGYLIELQF